MPQADLSRVAPIQLRLCFDRPIHQGEHDRDGARRRKARQRAKDAFANYRHPAHVTESTDWIERMLALQDQRRQEARRWRT